MSQIVSSGRAVSGGTVSGEGNILTVENGGSIQYGNRCERWCCF